MSEENKERTLKEKVREDIYLDFRDILAKREDMDNYPSPPNVKNFKSAIITFYSSIKHKLNITIEKKGLTKFQRVKDILDGVNEPNDLELGEARSLVFTFSEFLDEIGITEIWD